MARSDAYKQSLPSPVKNYLSWSSNDKCFTYYDKESGTTKKVAVPLRFIHCEEFASIKGFHDKSQSSIWSNEIKDTRKEELFVRSFKSQGNLVSGIYQDIKADILSLGGHYNLSMYAIVGDKLVNFAFKGAVLQFWSDFAKDNRKKFLTNYIEITGASDEKKGSVKYSVPVFALGAEIPAKESANADTLYDELKAYLASRKESSSSEELVHAEQEAEPLVTPKFDETYSKEDVSQLPF
jgi:hypothetical protein